MSLSDANDLMTLSACMVKVCVIMCADASRVHCTQLPASSHISLTLLLDVKAQMVAKPYLVQNTLEAAGVTMLF